MRRPGLGSASIQLAARSATDYPFLKFSCRTGAQVAAAFELGFAKARSPTRSAVTSSLCRSWSWEGRTPSQMQTLAGPGWKYWRC